MGNKVLVFMQWKESKLKRSISSPRAQTSVFMCCYFHLKKKKSKKLTFSVGSILSYLELWQKDELDC